jgi:hypothetical protein
MALKGKIGDGRIKATKSNGLLSTLPFVIIDNSIQLVIERNFYIQVSLICFNK